MLIICWDYDGTLVSSEFVYKNIFMNYIKKLGAVKKNITDEYYFNQYSGRHPITVIKDLQKNGYVDTNVELSVEKWDKIFQDEIKNEDDLILSKNEDEMTRLEFLNEIKDMINHNIMCYSSNYSLGQAKQGYEKDFARENKKLILVEQMIREERQKEKKKGKNKEAR